MATLPRLPCEQVCTNASTDNCVDERLTGALRMHAVMECCPLRSLMEEPTYYV